jgi:hypothetical protein
MNDDIAGEIIDLNIHHATHWNINRIAPMYFPSSGLVPSANDTICKAWSRMRSTATCNRDPASDSDSHDDESKWSHV